MLQLNSLHFRYLRGDALGGLTAAVVSLPLALTFGVASGAGAEAGLYGAILIGLFTSLFGGTATLISEPTGPMTVVMTAVIATLIAANPDNGLAMMQWILRHYEFVVRVGATPFSGNGFGSVILKRRSLHRAPSRTPIP